MLLASLDGEAGGHRAEVPGCDRGWHHGRALGPDGRGRQTGAWHSIQVSLPAGGRLKMAVRYDILAAVAARFAGLGLIPPPVITVRKKLVMLPEDALPMILVSLGRGGEERAGG